MKRLSVLLLTSLLAVLAVPVVLAPPGAAKGATNVVVTGPGIADRSLGFTRQMDDVDVGSLAELSGIYQIYGAEMASDDPGSAKGALGPRYVLTWYQGSTVMTVSYVYPFADTGAWAHIPDENGGWVRGGPDLEGAMVELGAERPQDDAEPGVSTSSTAVGSDSRTEVDPGKSLSSTVRGADPAWWAGLAALAVLAGGGAWLLRRRRTAGRNLLTTAGALPR